MNSLYFSSKHPNTSRKIGKGILILLIILLSGYAVFKLIPVGKKDTGKEAILTTAQKDENFTLKIFLIIIILIVAVYVILELSGILDKIKRWYSSIQRNQSGFTEPTNDPDFNEFQDR